MLIHVCLFYQRIIIFEFKQLLFDVIFFHKIQLKMKRKKRNMNKEKQRNMNENKET